MPLEIRRIGLVQQGLATQQGLGQRRWHTLDGITDDRCAGCNGRGYRLFDYPNYRVCSGCGEIWYNDAEERRERERNRDLIHPYSYKPKPVFFGISKDHLFFGIEHEVETRNEPIEFVKRLKALDRKGLFYCKPDGSIARGIEVVSHPMSLHYFNTNYPPAVAALFANEAMNNRDGHYSCGIHIHMSRAAFKRRPYHLYKFLQFIYGQPELVQYVAGRTEHESIVHGAVMASYNKAALGQLLMLPSEVRHGRLTVSKNAPPIRSADGYLREVARGKQFGWGRYMAVNCLNPTTLELRVFRSTVNHRRLRADVQFADAVFQYTKTARLHCRHDPAKELSAGGFRAFVSRYQRYADLQQVLEGNPAYDVG